MSAPLPRIVVGNLTGACRIAILLTGLHWIATGQYAVAGVAGAALVLSFLPGSLLQDPVMRDATSGVTAVLLAAHIVFGMLSGLYETSAVYDKAVHLVASAAIAGLLLLASRRWSEQRGLALPPEMAVMLVLAGTVTLGTLWELFEFTVDLTGAFVAQRGLEDTMLDLLADTVGAALTVGAFAGTATLRSRAA